MPQNQKPGTLEEILTAFDRTGFKLTGKLKALILSGEEAGLLRARARSDPAYDTTCLFCGKVYEEELGGMLLACTACAPIVERFFPTTGDWTREAFKALCQAIIEAGNGDLPDEDTWRFCRFCGRGTNLWVGTQFAAPDFCHQCADRLQEWDAQGYLRLFEETEQR